jgi:hypothetical protein
MFELQRWNKLFEQQSKNFNLSEYLLNKLFEQQRWTIETTKNTMPKICVFLTQIVG